MGLATQKEAAASRPAASENWCRGRDLNSHGVATATSRQRVYQFHHPDARNTSTASPPPWQALFLLSSRICRLSPAGATRAATLVLGKCRAFSAWQPVRLAGCRSAGRQGSLHETCSCQQAQTCYGSGRQQKPSLRAGRPPQRHGVAEGSGFLPRNCPEFAQNCPKMPRMSDKPACWAHRNSAAPEGPRPWRWRHRCGAPHAWPGRRGERHGCRCGIRRALWSGPGGARGRRSEASPARLAELA